MCERALPLALDIGIPERAFWEMTFGEVTRAVESYNRRKQAADKERAAWDYRMAELIGASVSRLFGGKYPAVHEAYPGLFEETAGGQDWRIAKERLMRYADNHNRRRRKEGKTA